MMESTQELECTQDLYASQLERSCPEQIGFLGICGEKYPVKRGPNKIGRDSQTCSIVLNLNSISRQHAVINILKGTEYHLMDLDSANKTKLNNKRLQPFIPYPLRNGDTLQFGDVFGVFRVLEEDNDLPMTQAIEIPETPVITKHASRVAMTTVPESPDVSDRDDSFIIPSQPTKGNNFKSPSNKFIKPCAKTITIQPVGSKKIDNVYWNSLKQSPNIKFNLDDSDSSLNNDADIYEMETQQPSVNKSSDSIYTADTQVPTATGAIYTADTQEPGDKYSIYTAETQIPTKESIFDADTQVPTKESIYETETQIMTEKESIYEVNTHIPTINGDIDANTSSIYLMDTQLPSEHLPTVKKINNQQNMHFDLCGEKQHIENNEFSTNKDEPTIGIEDDDLLNATTQVPIERPISPVISIGKGNNSNTPVKNRVEVNDNGVCEPGKSEVADKKSVDKNDRSIDKINTSEENILFEEVDGQSFEEDLDSQPLLPRDMSPNDDNLEIPLSQTFVEDDVNIILPAKRENRVNSDQSTDCEDLDIVPTQKIPQKLNDDDLTDCEDDFIESNTVKVSPENVDIDDMATQVIEEIEKPGPESTTATEDAFDDLATQVIPDIEIDKQVDFENMPSQVLNEAPLKCKIFNILKEDNCSEEMVPSPFKIPMQPSSPRKAKKKDYTKSHTPKIRLNDKAVQEIVDDLFTPPQSPKKYSMSKVNKSRKEGNDSKYYEATQDILNDLCTQEWSPEMVTINRSIRVNAKKNLLETQNLKQSSIDNFVVRDKEKEPNTFVACNFSESENDDRVNNFVNNLTNIQIRDVIGVDIQVKPLKRMPSDASDVEVTPKKIRPLLDGDMPDSQEIKTNASRFNSLVSESSSDSDTEKRSEESPINIYRKKKPVKITKQDLTKKFDAETLPVRVLTRVRKPTVKVQDNALGHKIVTNILTNRLIAANDEIDDDIISENIMRLKSKNDKTNHSININNTRSRSAINKPAAANENKEMKQETDKHKENKIKIKDNQRKNAIEKPVTKPRGRPRKQGSKVKDSKHTKGKDESTIIEPSDATGKINSLDSTSQSTKSTRGTRNKKEVGISKIEPSETSKSRGRKKHSEEKSKTTDNNDASSSDTKNEVRRSRRKAATDKEREKPKLKSILKNSVCKSIAHEQSTEYNVSSESNEESPNHLKRLADSDLEVPSPKRTRPSSANTSVRFLPSSMKSFRVLFTAFPFNEVRVKLEKLGATVVGDVTSCDVVVSRQVKRTVKFLCAVGLGKPLVGAQWVQACSDLGSLVDPWQYLIKDDENEKRFKFELQRTLSGERGYLAGYNVSATPNVEPRAPDMKMIVECSGGKWRASGPRWICITCLKDRALWDELRRRGARLVSCEFVLTGVLRQKLEIDLHRFPFCDACDTGHFVPPLCRYTRDQGNKKHSNKSGL